MHTIFDKVLDEIPQAKLVNSPDEITEAFNKKVDLRKMAMKRAWIYWRRNKGFYSNDWSLCLGYAWSDIKKEF